MTAALFNHVDPKFGPKAAEWVDKAGEFWHQTLLWDQVRNIQMGIFSDATEKFQKQGFDQRTADRMAAEQSNRLVGAIPQEAMSAGLTRLTSLLFFSRSFTFSNLGLFKDAFSGAPSPMLAQIEQDFKMAGASADQIAAARSAAGANASRAVSKAAFAALLMDVGVSHVVNSLTQSAVDSMVFNKSGNQIQDDYSARMKAEMDELAAHPGDPFYLLQHAFDLDPTMWNEPGKQNRILTGYNRDGSASYTRLPLGKVGEDLIMAATDPLKFLHNKLSPLVKPAMDLFSNSDSFGHPIYDPTAIGMAGVAENAGIAVKHLYQGMFPADMLSAAAHAAMGSATSNDYHKMVGDLTGFTQGKGYAGGPSEGVEAKAKRDLEAKQQISRRGIVDSVQHAAELTDSTERAQAMQTIHQQMLQLKMSPTAQSNLMKSALGTTNQAHKKQLLQHWFHQYGTPEEQESVKLLNVG